MTDLTPNRTPEGEKCGTCRFAATHTVAEERRDQVVVRCRRFPPFVPDYAQPARQLRGRPEQARWPHTLWDDWCGEWEERDPDPDAKPGPIGFVQGAER